MFDVLTYAIAKSKSAAQLAGQIAEIEGLVDSAAQSAALSQDLLTRTEAAAQQAAASASAVSYALGPDIDGRLAFFEKDVETEN